MKTLEEKALFKLCLTCFKLGVKAHKTNRVFATKKILSKTLKDIINK